jgi:hypothetical protein
MTGSVDHVADLEPFRLDVRGEDPVKGRAFEIALAPDHREGLARRQHVDRLAAAPDDELVDRQFVGLGSPGEGKIAGRKPLRRLNLERERGIIDLPPGFEPLLLVGKEHSNRRLVGLAPGGEAYRLHPGRHRAEQRFVGRLSGDRNQARRRQRKSPPMHDDFPPDGFLYR